MQRRYDIVEILYYIDCHWVTIDCLFLASSFNFLALNFKCLALTFKFLALSLNFLALQDLAALEPLADDCLTG